MLNWNPESKRRPWNFEHFMCPQVFCKWQNICTNRCKNSPILVCSLPMLTLDLTVWLALATGTTANRMETEIWKVLAYWGLPSFPELEPPRSSCEWAQASLLEDERPCGREPRLTNQQSTTLVANLPDEEWDYARSSSNQLTHQLSTNAWKSSPETIQAGLDQKQCLTNPQNHEQNNIVVILSKWNSGVVCYTAKANWYTPQSGLKADLYTHVVRHGTMWLPLLTTIDGTMVWSFGTNNLWGGPAEKSTLEYFSILDADWPIHSACFSLGESECKAPERCTNRQ